MTGHDRRDQLLAAGLAALAGFVDATGFIASGGFFLSFMSGNSTRLGVGLSHAAPEAAIAAGLLAMFVVGVMVGTLVGRAAGARRKAVVLALLAGLLAVAAALAGQGLTTTALLFAVLAMGAENSIFEADGNVQISLTFMTGNLVKIGQRLAVALTGGPRWEWLPYLGLWAAMVGGAVAGAALWTMAGLSGLWVASALATGLALVRWRDA